jgi:quinol monooxygenase YgiN
MRTLLARYLTQPGHADTVEATLQKMAAAVARDEPGCVLYRACRSVEEPDVFVLYEEYVDEAALLAHRETPYFRDLIEGTVVPLLISREREVLVPVTPATGGGS